ncbi:tetraspanin-32 isoform X1 [Lagenorhynchus albirostris]|uniref:tetraspanin-32 isoform X1 n=1 Tax=Lagenorhynchus albirostris TaxID=27610 RepID=UPI0028E5F88C|nr:tetraspanin-32 isoform X1 [Lagenorhynchus albirostris]
MDRWTDSQTPSRPPFPRHPSLDNRTLHVPQHILPQRAPKCQVLPQNHMPPSEWFRVETVTSRFLGDREPLRMPRPGGAVEVQDGARTAWGHPCPYLLACVLSSPRLCVPPWMGFGGSQHRQLRGRPEDSTHWTPGGPTGPAEVGSTLLVFACFQCQSPELGVVFPGMCRSPAFHLPSVCPGWAPQLHALGWEGRSGGPRALPSAQDCLQGIRNVLRTHRNIASTLISLGLASMVYVMPLSAFLWFAIRSGKYTLSPRARGCQPQEPHLYRRCQEGPAPHHLSEADALRGRRGPSSRSGHPPLLQDTHLPTHRSNREAPASARTRSFPGGDELFSSTWWWDGEGGDPTRQAASM